jgi:hypothetical protein
VDLQLLELILSPPAIAEEQQQQLGIVLDHIFTRFILLLNFHLL